MMTKRQCAADVINQSIIKAKALKRKNKLEADAKAKILYDLRVSNKYAIIKVEGGVNVWYPSLNSYRWYHRKKTAIHTAFGVTATISVLAKLHGRNPCSVRRKVAAGCSIEEALQYKIRPSRKVLEKI